MTDAAAASISMPPPPRPSSRKEDEDSKNPLLQASIPSLPTAMELETLLSKPPLSYNAARAAPPPPHAPPQRRFCELCGYWGRVKCLKCGSRVCGLECKEKHDLECRKRFA
jgi:zinc finger HIT domain-containing protein 1